MVDTRLVSSRNYNGRTDDDPLGVRTRETRHSYIEMIGKELRFLEQLFNDLLI